jgi:hypothetical protein
MSSDDKNFTEHVSELSEANSILEGIVEEPRGRVESGQKDTNKETEEVEGDADITKALRSKVMAIVYGSSGYISFSLPPCSGKAELTRRYPDLFINGDTIAGRMNEGEYEVIESEMEQRKLYSSRLLEYIMRNEGNQQRILLHSCDQMDYNTIDFVLPDNLFIQCLYNKHSRSAKASIFDGEKTLCATE